VIICFVDVGGIVWRLSLLKLSSHNFGCEHTWWRKRVVSCTLNYTSCKE